MNLTGNPYITPNDMSGGAGGVLKFSVATGAASGVDIAVLGIEPGDTVMYVHDFDSGVPIDRTSDVMLIKADAIQMSGASLSGDSLSIGWLDRLPG